CLVLLQITGRVVRREVDDHERQREPSGIDRLLQCHLHPVRLALHAVEQHAWNGLLLARHVSLLDGIDRSRKRWRKYLVALATRRLEPAAAAECCSAADRVAQDLER